jgi:hypothetical protein
VSPIFSEFVSTNGSALLSGKDPFKAHVPFTGNSYQIDKGIFRKRWWQSYDEDDKWLINHSANNDELFVREMADKGIRLPNPDGRQLDFFSAMKTTPKALYVLTPAAIVIGIEFENQSAALANAQATQGPNPNAGPGSAAGSSSPPVPYQ